MVLHGYSCLMSHMNSRHLTNPANQGQLPEGICIGQILSKTALPHVEKSAHSLKQTNCFCPGKTSSCMIHSPTQRMLKQKP